MPSVSLAPLPPVTSDFSKSSVVAPSSAACTVAATPEAPEPTTTISTSIVSSGLYEAAPPFVSAFAFVAPPSPFELHPPSMPAVASAAAATPAPCRKPRRVTFDSVMQLLPPYRFVDARPSACTYLCCPLV